MSGLSTAGRWRARQIVCAPASMKGVLLAGRAASALAQGVRAAGQRALEVPVADGGEATADVLQAALGGDWHYGAVHDPLDRPIRARFLMLPDRTAVIEASAALGLPLLADRERDPLRTSSRGLGELIRAALDLRPTELLLCLGGTATVDGGRGLREGLGRARFDIPVRVACDVANPLLGDRGAARTFGPQKGASPAMIDELERRLAADSKLRPFAQLAGAGAAGGLGAALASLGGELVNGAALVLETLRFRDRIRSAALVVTGEGTVDQTTRDGKAPAAVVAAARSQGVAVVIFGGRVVEPLPDIETIALSGDPDSAATDLVALGRSLADHIGAFRASGPSPGTLTDDLGSSEERSRQPRG